MPERGGCNGGSLPQGPGWGFGNIIVKIMGYGVSTRLSSGRLKITMILSVAVLPRADGDPESTLTKEWL